MSTAELTEEKDIVNTTWLWDQVCETNPDDTKKVEYGAHKFTAIDAYSQIKRATELFGSYGDKWAMREITYARIDDTPLMRVSGVFQYPSLSGGIAQFPISTAARFIDQKGKFDDEFAKKAETDLLTKALSKIGFNADVFLGKFDDNKYVKEVTEKFSEEHTPLQKQTFDNLIDEKNHLGLKLFLLTISPDAYASLLTTFPKGQKTTMKQIVRDSSAEGDRLLDQYEMSVRERIQSGDVGGLRELREELGEMGRNIIWNRLSNEDQLAARSLA